MRRQDSNHYFRIFTAEPRALTTLAIYASAAWATFSFIYSIAYINSFCSACVGYLSLSDIIGIALGSAGLLTIFSLFFAILVLPLFAPRSIFIGIFRFIIEKMFSKYFAIGAIRLVLIMALMPIIIIYFGKLIGFWEIRIFPEDTLLEQMWMAFALVFLGYQSLLLSFIENGKVYSSFRMLAALGISVSVLSLIYAVGDLNGASAYRNSKRLNCIQEARSDCTSILVLGNKLSVVVQNGDIFLLKTDSIDRVSLPEPKSLGSIWTSFGD